jgi:hypothetical protein
MGPDDRYSALADAVTALLLAVDGVRAVSAGADGLKVYVKQDDPAVREAVEKLVRPLDPRAAIHYEPTGEFRTL